MAGAEIVKVAVRETVVIECRGARETLVVEQPAIEIVEVVKQGPPGPPGESESQQFDTDLALLFEIAMLP